jgi:tetratricopeptide (TPR) repeat protein
MTKPLSDLDLDQLNKADQLMDEGDYAEAIEILGTLLVMPQAEPRIHALRGYASYRLEDYSKAIQDFDIAISAVPNAVNTLFLRGRSLEELGRFDDAIKDYRRVTTINPQTADAHAQLGFCLEMLGRMEEAKSAYEEALRYDPSETLALAGLKTLKQQDG